MTSVISFKAHDLQKELVPNPPPLPSLRDVPFGTIFSPHMLTIAFTNGKWCTPKIEPFHNLSLPPQTSCLHYGTTCFEGMKAYIDFSELNSTMDDKNIDNK
uniref:Branched-chain-amino-acid aminotransferase, mitochondrial n=1 Tax=Lygus hesperus TaxID=30085 RepID=A0A0A9Y961_LYGHE